jgi:hypothetical protein
MPNFKKLSKTYEKDALVALEQDRPHRFDL